MKKIKHSFIVILAFLSGLSAFADLEEIRAISNSTIELIADYTKKDIAAYGNCKEAGVTSLKVMRGPNQYYLEGLVWANSCHSWTDHQLDEPLRFAVYGGLNPNRGETGYNEIHFRLPISKADSGKWFAAYDRLAAGLGDGIPVGKVAPVPWRMDPPPAQVSSRYRYGSYVFYYGSKLVLLIKRLGQVLLGYGPFGGGGLYFNIEEIFRLCEPELNAIPVELDH